MKLFLCEYGQTILVRLLRPTHGRRFARHLCPPHFTLCGRSSNSAAYGKVHATTLIHANTMHRYFQQCDPLSGFLPNMDSTFQTLNRYFEERDWKEVREILNNQVVDIPVDVLNFKYLLKYPPLDVLLGCLSARNVTMELVEYVLDKVCSCDDECAYVMDTVVQHFRPRDLRAKPRLLFNDKEQYYFGVLLHAADDSISKQKCVSLPFPAQAAHAYKLLARAGFECEPLQKMYQSDINLGLNTALSKTMSDFCQHHQARCMSLQGLCRNVVRTHMTDLRKSAFQKLNIPTLFVEYLTLQTIEL